MLDGAVRAAVAVTILPVSTEALTVLSTWCGVSVDERVQYHSVVRVFTFPMELGMERGCPPPQKF